MGRIGDRATVTDHGSGEESGESEREREAAELCNFGKVGVLFFASVQEHDDQDEEHHNRATVDDDLHRSDEFRTHQQVETGESDHHDDYQNRAVDRMLLQNQPEPADDSDSNHQQETHY